MSGVAVTRGVGVVRVAGPFALGTRLRELPAATWDAQARAWSFPATAGAARALTKVLGEHPVLGELIGAEVGTREDELPHEPVAFPPWRHQLRGSWWLADRRAALLQYGLGCLTGDAEINVNRCGRGFRSRLDDLIARESRGWPKDAPTFVRGLRSDGTMGLVRLVGIKVTGERETILLTLRSGRSLRLTEGHEIVTPRGKVRADSLRPGDAVFVDEVGGRGKSLRERRSAPYLYGKLPDGRRLTRDGYVFLHAQRKHGKRRAALILEHHVVMEAMLGRQLRSGEVVHHRNGDRTDNRPENLQLLASGSDHALLHADRAHLAGVFPLVDHVLRVEFDGLVAPVFDLSVGDDAHTYVANGIVVGNTGKTRTAVDAARAVRARRVLVVCPRAVMATWRKQAALHAGDHFAVWTSEKGASTADKAQRLAAALKTAGDKPLLVAVNYETLWRGEFAALALRTAWDVVIYDEVHRIKAPGSKCSRFAARLRSSAAKSWGLSGTPLAHSPLDAYGIFRALDPGIFGTSFTRFRGRYCNTPEAPIWMADLSFKPIGEIKVGESVMGWIYENGRRRLAPSTVQAICRRTAPNIIRVTMASGRVIRCTPDHKWLSHHHGGAGSDLWVEAAPLRQLGSAKVPRGHCRICGNPCPRKDPRGPDPIYCGESCNAAAYHARRNAGTAPRRRVLSHVIDPTPTLSLEQQRHADWLAGVYDGEGSGRTISQSASHNPEVCAGIERALGALGLPWSRSRDGKGYTITGGRQAIINLLNWTRGTLVRDWKLRDTIFGVDQQTKAAINAGMRREGNRQLGAMPDAVANVESEGPGEVVSMQTSTGNYTAWGYASKNCVMGGFQNHQVLRYQNVDEFRRLYYSITLDQDRSVLDLPAAHHVEVPVTLPDWPARRAYDQVRDEFTTELASGEHITAGHALTRLLRLQQITSGSAPTDEQGAEGRPAELHAEKEDALAELLDDLDPAEPVVVFCRFRADLDRVCRAAERAGRLYYELSGSRRNLEAWQTSTDGSVLGVQIQSGGEGIDLTRAAHCFYFSVPLSLAQYDQSLARVHRPGQTRPVTYYHLIASATVDGYIYRLLRKRREVIDAVLNEGVRDE